ncbi:MAG: hypothetical protein Q9184_004548 [Pyrenodesmia sp. 2 TL-2023]
MIMPPSITLASLGIGILAALAQAQGDPNAKLDKPPIVDNLDYLQEGLLQNFPSASANTDAWGPGWIPKDCKDIVTGAKLNPADITTYNVNYDDCNTAWVLCYHKDNPTPFQNVVETFGRVPVGARQFVRHVVALPDTSGHAFNANGNLAMFDIDADILTVYLHETAHSLDLQGAYDGGQLSSSKKWWDEYSQDPNIPDPYAGSDSIENVAQNTVIAAYDTVVPGGYAAIEPRAGDIFRQYATVITKQRESGDLLVPSGTCGRRLQNSETVEVDDGGAKLRRGVRARGDKPDTSLGEGIEVIERVEFNTGESCSRTYGKGDGHKH